MKHSRKPRPQADIGRRNFLSAASAPLVLAGLGPLASAAFPAEATNKPVATAGKTWLEVSVNGPWSRDRQPLIPISVKEIVADSVACARGRGRRACACLRREDRAPARRCGSVHRDHRRRRDRVSHADAFLQLLANEAPRAPWMIAGLDVDITPLIAYAVERGGHVRVGLEDAPFGASKTNVQLVEEAARMIRSAGSELASTQEIRRALGHG